MLLLLALRTSSEDEIRHRVTGVRGGQCECHQSTLDKLGPPGFNELRLVWKNDFAGRVAEKTEARIRVSAYLKCLILSTQECVNSRLFSCHG